MFRTIIWGAAVGCWCAGARADFVAYNDFGGTSPGNVTAISLSQSGLLKDFSSGANTPVTLNVVNGSPASATDGTTGASPTGGDAFNIFNGKVNMAGYIWYNNVITVPYSNCRLDFTGLNPSKTYEIVLSANRDNSAYVARNTQFVISDVGAFTNSHSTGTVTYTTTTTNDSVSFNTGYNTLNGYVARWIVTSGPDGDFSVNVTAAPASGNANDDGRWYLGAMRLTEATSYDFQQGLNGYVDSVDTFLQGINPNTNLGSTTPLKWDTDDGGLPDYALVRFDNIFGTGAGQIQPTDTIVSATLYYNVGGDANATGNNATVHEALVNWAETDTFNTFGGEADVQADEYGPSLGAAAGGTLGQASVNVTSSITAWKSNPSANHGWIFRPTGTDGTQVTSKEDATVSLRPRLSVLIIPGTTSGSTLTLQDGLSGYTDTVDTFLQGTFPTANNSTVSPIKWDGEDTGGVDYALVRFNNLFGNGANQIKSTDVITSATLVLTVNDLGNTGTIHESLVNWAETDTFNTFGGEADVQADEYGPSLGNISGAALGAQTVDVTTSLAAWQANGSPNTANLGWIIRPTGTDGVQVRSREYATTPSERPKLIVQLNGGAPSFKTLFVKYQPYLQLGNAPLQSTGGGIGTTDQIVIAWQTVESGTGSAPNDYFEVEYRHVGAGSYIPVTPVNVLNTGTQTRLNHSVTITGLNYDDDYEYRVIHKRNPSSPVTVTTYNGTIHTRKAPNSTLSFSFAAFGDAADKYSGELPQAESVNARVATLGVPFVMLLGDNIYPSGTHDDMDAIFETAIVPTKSAYIRNHVQYFCMGNHDAGTNNGQPSLDDFYCPIPVLGVTSPVAPASGETPEKNYSFDYGLVHFTVIESCAWGDPGSSASRQAAIATWMAADLAASNQPWKIVAAHHPPKSLVGHSDTPNDMACDIFPRMIANGADLLLVGHSHDYQRSFPLIGHSGAPGCTGGDVTWIADPSGAYTKGAQTIQVLAGTGGKNIDGPAPTSATQWLAKAFGNNNGGQVGPFVIDVTPTQLTCKFMLASSGTVMDQFTITTPGPSIATSVASISRTVFLGDPLSDDIFNVRNSGVGTITYSINDNAGWLSVAPPNGTSTGENDPITVSYDVGQLTPAGVYNATITITAPEAGNSPKNIPVTITVQSVRPDFDGDGDVDQSDFSFLQNCFTGPAFPVTGNCTLADLNLTPDGSVDSGDLVVFLNCMSGPDTLADRNCD